jgi:hypothetical protein
MYRVGIVLVLVVVAFVGGVGAYTVGIALQRGQVMLSSDTIRIAATAVFLAMVVGIVPRASRLRERINTDHLLTTVAASEVVFGVVLAVASQIAILISPVVVGGAVGFALGIGSLAGTLPILVAFAGLFALAVTFGVVVSFLIQRIATRSPRFRRYKTALGLTASFLVFAGYNLARDGALPIDVVLDGLTVIPTAWFVDLGGLGIVGVQSSVLRSAGALVVVVGGVPVLMAVATGLATQIWETEPVSATTIHRSRSLIGDGLPERLFAGHVSRPVLTIARKRWLQERRIPLGLILTSAVWIFSLGVIAPVGVSDRIPGLSVVFLVYILGVGTGLAFGIAPVSTEYSSLSMTLTTVSGEQFVRGELLSGIAVGVPITALLTAFLAVLSPLGELETLLFVISGIVFCLCGSALALAIGLGVSSRDLAPMPLPFTKTIVYDEHGYGTLRTAGLLVGVFALVCVPALGGYVAAFFNLHTTVFGIQIAAFRVWLLLLTDLIALGVIPVAYRRAVQLYDQYTIS